MRAFWALSLIFCLLICSCSGQPNKGGAVSDSTFVHIQTNEIVIKLDSITRLDTALKIGPSWNAYLLFKEMRNRLKDKELIDLLKMHDNSVVRGYAYMALKLRNNNKAEPLYRSNYKNIKYLCVYDVCHTYSDSNVFINELNKKIKRIENFEKMKSQDYISDEEKKVIEEEEKIRKEQGVAPSTPK